MTSQETTVSRAESGDGDPDQDAPIRTGLATPPWYSYRNIGAVYVLLGIILIFSLVKPELFPTGQTARTVLNEYAVTGLVALSLVIPLSAGLFDLSVGYTLGLCGITAAWLMANTGLPPLAVVGAATVVAVAVGLFNALLIVRFRISSIVATLGSGAILYALTLGISGEQSITGRVGELSSLVARGKIFGVTYPVFYALVVMVVVGFVLDRTPLGRYWYAVGFDNESSRLAGLPVGKLQVWALLASAVIAGVAGVVLTARIGAGSPNVGASYLLPAFAAGFLGATQFRQGRFNAWGTILAVLLLGTGTVGLLLVGAPIWGADVFQGIALLVAVGLTGFERRAITG